MLGILGISFPVRSVLNATAPSPIRAVLTAPESHRGTQKALARGAGGNAGERGKEAKKVCGLVRIGADRQTCAGKRKAPRT